jgi:hypothetical protein
MPFVSPFAGATPITLLCDRPDVAAAARRLGWPDVRCLDHLTGAPVATALLLATHPDTHRDDRLCPLLQQSRTFYLGLQAFDPAPAAAAYTLAALGRCDVPAALRRNRRWLRRLERQQRFCFASGPAGATRLTVEPADELDVGTITTCDLAIGELVALGACFEVELEGFGTATRPFAVDGELAAAGVLYALADDFTGDRWAALTRGRRVFEAAQRGGLRLRIADNAVVACDTPAGDSLLPDLRAALNGNLLLTEVAIGTNRLPAPEFSVNAQINEGAGGFHVGLGGGEQGLHLDFVAPSARVVPEEQP